jgi:multicomponent Na+:H+ antiporter subunit E
MWCVLSGKFDALHLGTGLVAAGVVAAMTLRWRAPERLPVWRLLAYAPGLVWAILKSNIHVAWLVLVRPGAVAPQFVTVRHGLSSARAQTLLGCSITLTPGTVTVEMGPEEALVHALDAFSAEDLASGAGVAGVRAVFVETAAEVRP